MGKKKCPECKPGAPEFMNTYGDMMTLLLCFFVLLFAFSTTDSQKFTTLMEAFQGSFGVMSGGKTISAEQNPLITNARVPTSGTQMKFQKMAELVKQALEKEADKRETSKAEDRIKEDDVVVKLSQRGIEISLGDSTLFELGKSKLKPAAKVLLKNLYKELIGIESQMIIEGHTDNLPISTLQFPSNWELSTSRATNVLRYLLSQDETLKKRISAAGYAETKPIATNRTTQGRRKNRRVDIVILKSLEERVAEKIQEKSKEGNFQKEVKKKQGSEK